MRWALVLLVVLACMSWLWHRAALPTHAELVGHLRAQYECSLPERDDNLDQALTRWSLLHRHETQRFADWDLEIVAPGGVPSSGVTYYEGTGFWAGIRRAYAAPPRITVRARPRSLMARLRALLGE